MTWTLPNVLTTLRLLAAPAVALMFLYFTRPYADWVLKRRASNEDRQCCDPLVHRPSARKEKEGNLPAPHRSWVGVHLSCAIQRFHNNEKEGEWIQPDQSPYPKESSQLQLLRPPLRMTRQESVKDSMDLLFPDRLGSDSSSHSIQTERWSARG